MSIEEQDSKRVDEIELFLREINKKYEYIRMAFIELKPKTEVYGILNKKSDDALGRVKWYAGWRAYCFFPEVEYGYQTIFSSGCLRDIIVFIDNLHERRKKK